MTGSQCVLTPMYIPLGSTVELNISRECNVLESAFVTFASAARGIYVNRLFCQNPAVGSHTDCISYEETARAIRLSAFSFVAAYGVRTFGDRRSCSTGKDGHEGESNGLGDLHCVLRQILEQDREGLRWIQLKKVEARGAL